jgi:hypothetical protein
MPIVDTDIFGKPEGASSTVIRDTDIFSAPAKAEAAPEEAPKPTLTETQALIQRAKSMGWGTGFPKVMDQLGSRVGEATGSPAFGSALGTTLGFLPDAIQMATGGEIAKTAGAPMLDAAGKFLMSSALKPGLGAFRKNMAEPGVKTMLDEGMNVTSGGLEKMRGTIGDLAQQVRDSISNSGSMIDVHRVADYAANAYNKFRGGPLANQAIGDIGKAQGELLAIPEIAGAREIPVQLAQESKSSYYRALTDKAYGELGTPTTEAEKQIARGYKELIGQAVPAVTGPLSRESALINALTMAERQVANDARKNPLGLGSLITQPWMVPFWMWDRSPLAKSLTARMLYSGQETLPALTGQGLAGAALYRPDGQ